MQEQSGVLVDGGDRGCGELLLELHRRVRSLPAGTRVRLVTADPGAPADILSWCALTGHHYLGPAVAADGRAAYDFTTSPRSDQ